MDEKKYAVLLTDDQDVKILECDPQEEMFNIARETIGCDWIELIEPESLIKDGYLMLIDEEGKLRDGDLSVNCIASELYGSDRHGDPIIGNVMVVKAEGEWLGLLTNDEAGKLATDFEQKRDHAIEKISRAFGILPVPKVQPEKKELTRRQTCKGHDMER